MPFSPESVTAAPTVCAWCSSALFRCHPCDYCWSMPTEVANMLINVVPLTVASSQFKLLPSRSTNLSAYFVSILVNTRIEVPKFPQNTSNGGQCQPFHSLYFQYALVRWCACPGTHNWMRHQALWFKKACAIGFNFIELHRLRVLFNPIIVLLV